MDAMDAIAALLPAAATVALMYLKIERNRPLSWPMVLAPLALYALPLLLTLALTIGILWMLCKLPGMKLLLGVPLAGAAAVIAAAAVWLRKLITALKK